MGRLGGDEFLVVLCHDHSCDGDSVVARIRESVGNCRIPVEDVLVPLEASVGVALTQCDSDTDPMPPRPSGRRGHVRGEEDRTGHPGSKHLCRRLTLQAVASSRTKTAQRHH